MEKRAHTPTEKKMNDSAEEISQEKGKVFKEEIHFS